MFLIVGLGNPGKQYENTWHSLGFLAIDEFARKNGFPDFRPDRKSNSLISKKENIILAKPQTFMNESGKAVKALFKNIFPKAMPAASKRRLNSAMAELRQQLIVIHDDADLPKGEIRISRDRGAAGHKGIDSIVKALKSKNFIRIRIGVRPANYVPGSKSLDRFVLKKFAKNEEKVVAEVIEKTSEAIGLILKEGVEKTMSVSNK